MKLSPQLKRRLRWQNTIFVILLLILVSSLGWLSSKFHGFIDLTASQNSYPSSETEQLLRLIKEPIKIKAFVSPDNKATGKQITKLISKYQRIKPDITLQIIDPIREPQLIRDFNIRNEGELIVSIGDEIEHVNNATEELLTNAINQISRSSQDWILFLEGHNERSPFGDTGFDYGAWHKILNKNGFNVRNYNLANNSQIPENTALLIIADPQKQFLQGEINILLDYIARGGNLLWLLEPGDVKGLDMLAEALGIEILPGVVVDPNTQAVGINDPRFTLITGYPTPDITKELNSISIFPTALGLDFFGTDEWDASIILETLPRTWTAEGNVSDITIDSPPNINGPLVIGYGITRAQAITDSVEENIDNEAIDEEEIQLEQDKLEQRIVVIGDSDFVSDAYIGEAANLDVASNVISWLIQSEHYIDITLREKYDRTLTLGKTSQAIIGFGFLIILPASLLLTGFILWRKRRKA